MSKLKRVIGTSLLISALVHPAAAPAATYYVAAIGNDSNPGTEKKPWGTVAYAVDTMVAGDTTYVRGGTYNESEIRFSKTGTRTAPIKLLNYPNEWPVLHFNNAAHLHRILIQHGSGSRIPIGWITIEGFEIAHAYDGIKMHNGHDVTIRRNWIHDSLYQGILGNGTRILIDRNRINHNGGFDACVVNKPRCTLDHGIYMNGAAITITNNLIYDNLCYGIQANGKASYDHAKHPGPEYLRSSDWIIANNTIAYNGCSGIVAWGSTLLNLRIENNIFYENAVQKSPSAVQGIHFVSMTSTGIIINNNHFYASGVGGTLAFGLGAISNVHYAQSGNIVNVTEPAFVNAPATLPRSPNFTLTARSPAIDAGATLTTIREAFDGTPRPQGVTYDIGAYEYKIDDAGKHYTNP
ncbi:MAG: right-handed parallel beta-helix repeat-containing protein [Nitrospiraceae bacterium]